MRSLRNRSSVGKAVGQHAFWLMSTEFAFTIRLHLVLLL